MRWIKNTTVGEFFDRQADEMPLQKALISLHHDDITFKELKNISNLLARGMIDLGVRKGDKIAVWAYNMPEWVFLFLALSKIGAIMVPLNPNLRTRDLRYDLKKADVKLLFLIDRLNGTDYGEILHRAIPDLHVSASGKVESKELPYLERIVTLGKNPLPQSLSFSNIFERAKKVNDADFHSIRETVTSLDTFIIKFTCGMSGYSRGAMLTHFGLINNALPIARKLNLGPSDVLCPPVPFHYIFGFWLGLLAPFTTHTPIVILPKYSASEVLKAVEEKRCTALYGVPTMFSDLLNYSSFSHFDLSSLRTGIMSGDYCPPEIVKQTIEKMSIPELTTAYGITEVGLLTQTGWNEKLEKTINTVGQPLDGMELKVINPENGELVPPGKKGEICVRSPVIMKGYYAMPRETSEMMDEDGWFHTGDLGLMDEEGYYRITGRKRNLIIRGGENIYPLEVEKFLVTCPDVFDALVVGVPSRRLSEEVFAFVKTNNGSNCNPQSIREYCRAEISRHQIPRWIKIVDEFPEKKDGTIDRNELRRCAMQELKLQEDHPLEIIYEH